jgi:hypothetical protein
MRLQFAPFCFVRLSLVLVPNEIVHRGHAGLCLENVRIEVGSGASHTSGLEKVTEEKLGYMAWLTVAKLTLK